MGKQSKSKAVRRTAETEQEPSVVVKRRVGRPRKSEQRVSEKVSPAEDSRTPRRSGKRSGTSTRDLIIASANQIINRTGVVDFRIETLAQMLSLSPGNITYHFPKKEDIIAAIWEEYLFVMQEITSEMLTPLLDVKQLYLYCRTAAAKTVHYVGVTTYYFGDMGALIRENGVLRHHVARAREMLFAGYDILARNGYMRPIPSERLRELTFDSQLTMLRWWVNHALTKHKTQDLQVLMDKYIALALIQLLPYLTDEGRRQFESIASLIR